MSIEDSTVEEAHSPCLKGLLRFSPANSWSPRPSTTRGTTKSKGIFFADEVQTPKTPAPTRQQDGIPLDVLRKLANNSTFYASLLYTKTNHPQDALRLATAYLEEKKQPTACLRCLEDSGVLQSEDPWQGLDLACQALAQQHEWLSIAQLLEDACRIPSSTTQQETQPLTDKDDFGWHVLHGSIESDEPIHVLARLCWWRGQAYMETGHGARAAVYWKRALQMDVQCEKAWESLLRKQLWTAKQMHELLRELDFGSSKEWLKALYMSSLQLVAGSEKDENTMMEANKIQQDVDTAFNTLTGDFKLEAAPQVLAMSARRAFQRYQWEEALQYCERLAAVDPHVAGADYCYLAVLVLLGRKQVLFRLAHGWVEADSKAATSWLAVGCYYFACQRFHVAQRHFCRATRLDPQCTAAWIAFGCSFAACDESDQALASFRAAQRLSPGDHTTLLYMGMEYVRTNHLVLAQHFLKAALDSCDGSDPLVLHEMGVWHAHKEEWNQAAVWLEKAKAAVGTDDPFWEPTVYNLGHAYRHLGQYEKALECFEMCVALLPRSSAYAAVGLTQHLMDDLDGAIESYHQALSMKADDPFSSDMLQRALKDQMTRAFRVDENMESNSMMSPGSNLMSPISMDMDFSALQEDSFE